jgi:hypothetical protein
MTTRYILVQEKNAMATRQRSTYTREAFYGKAATSSFGVKRHKISLYIDAFIAERQLRGIAAATITSYTVGLAMFGSGLEQERHSHDPATWTAPFIKTYLTYLQCRPTRHGNKLSQITLRSCTSRLLAFLKWVHEEGYTTTNIAASIRRPSAPSHVVQGFSPDELLCMVNATRDDRRNGLRDVAIISLLLDSFSSCPFYCRTYVLILQRLFGFIPTFSCLQKGGHETL